MFSNDEFAIRPWQSSDAARLLEIRSIPEVAKWLASPDAWTEVSQAEDAIVRWQEATDADDVLGAWAVVPHGDPVAGSVSLQLSPDGKEVTIGWYLHPDSSGHGWASRASRELLRIGFEQGAERVWAAMWPENEASARVALSIGMTDLGVIVDNWYGEEGSPCSRMFCAYRETWPAS